MRVFLNAFGTLGDVRPMLGIGRELAELGHDVVFFANPFFAERVERAGVAFRPVGEPLDPEDIVKNPRLRHPYFGPLRIWRELFEPQVALFFDAIVEEARAGAPDVVVNHPWCFGGMMAAEALERPWAVATLAPLLWFSTEDPPMASAFEPPRWMHAWSVGVMLRSMLNRVFGPDLDRFAREHGLPRIPQRYYWSTRGAALNLGMWSEAVRGHASDDPPNALICGFPEDHSLAELPPLDPRLEAFVDAGEPPLVMGLGSALPKLFPELYGLVRDACARLGWRAVLVGAPDGCVPEGDASMFATPFAPYSTLFTRARVIVHHGGVGSLAEASAAGAPQLVLPQGSDQYDNAWRVELLGVGARCVPGKLGVARLASLLERIDASEQVRAECAALAGRLRAEPAGARVAARAIHERWGAA